MKIKVLGSGCPKCQKLEENIRQAVTELGIESTIEKVTDITQIIEYGVMATPAIVIDEKVISVGKVADVEEIKKHLTSDQPSSTCCCQHCDCQN